MSVTHGVRQFKKGVILLQLYHRVKKKKIANSFILIDVEVHLIELPNKLKPFHHIIR